MNKMMLRRMHHPLTVNTRKEFSSSTSLHLNRVLFDSTECSVSENGEVSVTLAPGDFRGDHIEKILKFKIGDKIRCGILNQGMNDTSEIRQCDTEGVVISMGNKSDLQLNSRPVVDLILAIPRPIRLEKLLPVISCIGVGNLVLIGASKVNKDYFGMKYIQKPESMHRGLMDGLSQAEVDCLLPNLTVQRSLDAFFKYELDKIWPIEETHRFIAHPVLPLLPGQIENTTPSQRLFQLSGVKADQKKRAVVAIGPEGGWEEAEIQLFVDHGFHVINAGNRILRTDMAVSQFSNEINGLMP